MYDPLSPCAAGELGPVPAERLGGQSQPLSHCQVGCQGVDLAGHRQLVLDGDDGRVDDVADVVGHYVRDARPARLAGRLLQTLLRVSPVENAHQSSVGGCHKDARYAGTLQALRDRL